MEFNRLVDIQKALLSGELTMQKVVNSYLLNIEKYKHLNAYIEVFSEEILQKAKQLDEKIISNPSQLGKLFGCVVSIKDLIVYKNHPINGGSKILEGFVSQFSATAVDAMLNEDAIIIGRTNCDEFGMGSANINSYFGPVRNADDESRVSGGSSGGAAVSLQTNTCLIALGTDTGGSVRQPASLCGLYGYKPSYGCVSRHGLIAYASSFDQLGIFAHHTEDIDKVMEIISINDEYDATMFQQRLYQNQEEQETETSFRIAYIDEALETETLDSDIANSIKKKLNSWKEMGMPVDKINFPYLPYLVPCYYILTTAEASSNLSRFDGARYGYRSPKSETLEEMYVNTRSEGFGKEVQKRIMLGSFVLSEAYYDTYFTKAQKIRTLIRQKIKEIFDNYDFIILPTTPRPAWKIDEKPADATENYYADIYTVLANLAGVPAITVPIGKNDAGLSYGMQILADVRKDKKLLKFVQKYNLAQ